MNTFSPQLNMDHIVTAWRGHRTFAQWLVRHLHADVTVDLGVDQGYSTFCFAEPGQGQVYAVDWFEGDAHTGYRNTQAQVQDQIIAWDLRNITLLKTRFDDLAALWWRPIDVLHIDGLHTLEACQHDWDTWSPWVRKSGVVLMHDVVAYPDVAQVFQGCPGYRLWFDHDCGLGVVTQDPTLALAIRVYFPEVHVDE